MTDDELVLCQAAVRSKFITLAWLESDLKKTALGILYRAHVGRVYKPCRNKMKALTQKIGMKELREIGKSRSMQVK